MLKNTFREKTLRGEKTTGIFFEMGNTMVAEAIAMSELDYFIVDAEHGPFEVESTMEIIRAAELHNGTTFVRVKDSSRPSILKMLDVGAKGLIIPNVHSIEEIRRIVEYGKYYPLGRRGVAFGRSAGYGFAEHARGNINDYFSICNRETLLIPQCETLGCLNDIENIAKVEGVDGIFVGPYDLSVAMGIPAQFDNPQFKAALQRIQKAVKSAGKFSIIYCPDAETAKIRFSEGFDSATVLIDVIVYVNAMNKLVEEVKS